jgi:hypothetical protein
VEARENVVFLGPPGTGKTHLAIALGIRACQAGHRVGFATAAQWVARLAEAHGAGRLQAELVRLGRSPLLVIDEVGYIPFEAEAANLFFQLVSSRYERASVIVTSNKPFGRWGEVFGDATVAAAMIDRLVHHAEVVSLKGDSYRLKDRDLGRVPDRRRSLTPDPVGGVNIQPLERGQFSGVVDRGNVRRRSEALNEVSRRVVAACRGISSPLNVNVVFHVPGPILEPEFTGLRTGTNSRQQAKLMAQIAIRAPSPEGTTPKVENLLRQAMEVAELGHGGERLRLASMQFATSLLMR